MLRRIPPVVVVVAALVLPAVASAQNARSWVSGVGDDANPCSRTAPCKTFAGAISKTDAGGEIDALDPGGFGALTITKAITIDGGGGTVGGVLVSGTDAIRVAAGAGDHVILRNLRIDGAAIPAVALPAGLNGVNFTSGGSLRIENTQIYGFGESGVNDVSPNSSLVVAGSSITNTAGDGVLVAPPAGTAAQALVENTLLENNTCGVAAGAFGTNGAAPNFGSDCGMAGSGPAASAVNVALTGASASGNSGAGVLSDGPPSTVFLSSASVFGNGTGLLARNGGSIVSVGANNSVFGNGTNGTPTSTMDTGARGPQGGPGTPGANGLSGQVVLVSCQTVTKRVKVRGRHGKKKAVLRKSKKCTARPITGTVTFTTG